MVWKGLIVVILFGSIVMLAYYLSRPKPLRPIVITWQEVGRVIIVVDLDADGNDELLVEDQSRQLWWVQFRLPTPIRQKLPVSRDALWAHANCFADLRGQIWPFVQDRIHPRRAFLITRQGGKWALKDLGKFSFDYVIWVTDADHDGQVNDVVVRREQTRTVFSRLKDGTIVERPNLPDWQADLDGDGKDDEVYWVYWVHQTEVLIRCSSGCKASLKLPSSTFSIAVADMDGDKVVEIVSAERLGVGWRFHCWRYENGRWRNSVSPKFGSFVLSDDAPSHFLLFRDEKGAYLLAVTLEGQHAKIWEVRWRGGKWTKRLMGKVPERNGNKIWLVRKGQDWMVSGWVLPKWQKWLWEKVGQPLQRFLPFLQEPQERFFVYGWDGKRRWALLGRWRKGNLSLLGDQWVDMDGDGERELSIAFQRRVLVAKFEDGRWRTGWVEVPFVEYNPIRSFYGFRYGGREWALYQEQDSHRCVAIALEGDGQQSKRHQPQRRN